MRRLCIALLAAWGLAVGRAPNIADAAAATADATAAATADATAAATGDADLVRLADDRLQLGLDRVHGALRELIQLPDGTNQLDDGPAAWLVGLIVLGALVLLVLVLWGLARLTAWEPRWLPAARHSVGEAGYRTSAGWAEFRDWLRFR